MKLTDADAELELEKEREANAFAYELLMPVDKFVEVYKKYPDAISLVASEFNVSITHVLIRIKDLKQAGLI